MYRCNETGREFEKPIYDRDFWNENDGAYVCPCCGDTHYDEVFECDICRAHVSWDEGHVGSRYDKSFLCPAGGWSHPPGATDKFPVPGLPRHCHRQPV